MANDGPLPTPFISNPECDTEMTHLYDVGYLLQGPELGYKRCMPDKYVPSRDHYYSPYSTGHSGGAFNTYSVQLRYIVADETSGPTTSPATSSSAGLSTGAAVGIGLGCTVAVIALVAAAAFLFMRSRRNH
ncbi:hypothetical protein PG994_004878 [Apiospora phragmitis]|uniref:Uncharacterized protein n=1 Tax=Apiospora phragmitis TaxID=2905665 RepID=A0ABR1VRU9_9PEZI